MKKLLITGDSLSYNFYGYLEEFKKNACQCPVGMNSWSFRLRRNFIQSAPCFKYGCELEFKEKTICGMGENVDDINAFFGDKVVTVSPKNGLIHLKALSDTGKITLYIQRRYDNYCRFNITVDSVPHTERIDTYGTDSDFCGFDLITVEMECDKNKKVHEIVLSDFEQTEKYPLVTIAGASSEARYAYISGQGGRTSKFLLYHFEDRIEKYHPDLLILIFGGNDSLYYSEDEYRLYLTRLFEKMKKSFSNFRFLTLTIPPSGKCLDEVRGIKIENDDDTNRLLEKYNRVLEDVSLKFGGECLKLKDIFEDISPDIWRFDNVHFTNKGNDMLYDAVCEKLKQF